ncbi:MAG TPA: kelch repeat-containing protein [Puia sp.]|nr:kelch repeat-containing protein [Puia sp.]
MLFKICLVALLWTYNTSANPSQSSKRCWKTLAPIKGGRRQEHSVVASGDTIYILCGLRPGKKSEDTTAAVEAYNTKTNTWTELAPAPLPLHHANVAAVDGKIYVLGGIAGTIMDGEPTGRSFRYDIAAKKWMDIAKMPSGLGSAAMGVHGKKIYLAGGIRRGTSSVTGPGYFIVGDVASYDTETDKWTKHPELSLPEDRDHSGGMVVDDTFYVVGGRVGNQFSNRKTVYALKLTAPNRKWMEMAPLPYTRGGIAAAATGGKIYAFGGEGNGLNPNGTFPEVGIFDIARNRSEAGTPMPYPRHGFGAVAIKDVIYLPGGGLRMGGGGMSDVNDAYVPC